MQNNFVIQFVSRSHKGKVRKNNQDYLAINKKLNFSVIADGIGGRHYGEVASEVSVASCMEYMSDLSIDILSSKPLRELTNAIKFSNESVVALQQNEPKYKNMGSTLVCFWVDKNKVHYSWVGDSRIYLLRPSKQSVDLLTTDHTLDKDKIDPLLSPELYRRASSILTQSIGSNVLLLKPDALCTEIQCGDVLLACTDGLSDLVSAELMLEYAEKYINDLDGLADRLLDRALDCGGHDNISLILAQI